MNINRTAARVALLIVAATIVLLLPARAKPKPGDLKPRELRACQAYLAELRALPNQEPIVDSDTVTAEDRFEPAGDIHRPAPELSDAAIRSAHFGIVVLAGVIELDGTISHAKVVVSSGNAALDEHMAKGFRATWFDRPARVAGKPVRSFFTLKSSFYTNAPGT